MFRFADPNFLYLLILLPFLVALYLYSNYHRRQNIRKYGDPALLKGLMPTTVSYTHLRAHETGRNLVCRLLLEKKKK